MLNPQLLFFFFFFSWHEFNTNPLQIQQIIIIIPTTFPPADDNFAFLLSLALVLRNCIQQILELLLGDLLAELACLCEHNQSALDIGSARFLDEADAVETVDGFGFENLVEDGGTAFTYQG